jgi:sensor histidine kinase YesM
MPLLFVIVASWSKHGLLCALFAVVFVYLREGDESAARAQEAESARARFVQRMEEARLRMLQAQIEPHFLFNTLATVRRLYQTDSADAATMLDNLMRYFTIALPQMRAADSTLGREAELTESYLSLQKIRMGRRLAFDIKIPAPLRDARLPPMMLLTLVENAIKHGLAPMPEGGTVNVSAATKDGELQVCVADSGRGFAKSSGGGTGLANIRARLSGMYGSAGRLALSANAPRGVVASIAVPLSTTRAVTGAA